MYHKNVSSSHPNSISNLKRVFFKETRQAYLKMCMEGKCLITSKIMFALPNISIYYEAMISHCGMWCYYKYRKMPLQGNAGNVPTHTGKNDI